MRLGDWTAAGKCYDDKCYEKCTWSCVALGIASGVGRLGGVLMGLKVTGLVVCLDPCGAYV